MADIRKYELMNWGWAGQVQTDLAGQEERGELRSVQCCGLKKKQHKCRSNGKHSSKHDSLWEYSLLPTPLPQPKTFNLAGLNVFGWRVKPGVNRKGTKMETEYLFALM